MSGGAKLAMRAFKLLAKAGAGLPSGFFWEAWTFENWEDSLSRNWEDLI